MVQGYALVQAYMDARLTPSHPWTRYKVMWGGDGISFDTLSYADIFWNPLTNQVLVGLLTSLALYGLSLALLDGRGFELSWRRLSGTEMTVSVLANYVCYDGLFWLGHRLLHTRALYSYHKLHHLTYGTIGVSGNYQSALDFVLTQSLPTMACTVVLGTHWTSLLIPIAVGGLNGVHSHGAYAFPVSNRASGLHRAGL
jgi:sterol desaturase/sphingolipid hydroxylase (fatty acid hydroxylase superfamily)